MRPTRNEYAEREWAVLSLLDFARVDVDVAGLLAGAGYRAHAAYCLSQGAEKLVKAVLNAEGVNMGMTSHHKIGELAALVPAVNVLQAELGALDFMTAWATRFRYPTTRAGLVHEPPSEEALKQHAATLRGHLQDAFHECEHMLLEWKDGKRR